MISIFSLIFYVSVKRKQEGKKKSYRNLYSEIMIKKVIWLTIILFQVQQYLHFTETSYPFGCQLEAVETTQAAETTQAVGMYIPYLNEYTSKDIYMISHGLWLDMIYIQQVLCFLSLSLGQPYPTTTNGIFFLSHALHIQLAHVLHCFYV